MQQITVASYPNKVHTNTKEGHWRKILLFFVSKVENRQIKRKSGEKIKKKKKKGKVSSEKLLIQATGGTLQS